MVFEGLDVSGKSTIAKTIGANEGWEYYKTPPAVFFDRCLKLNEDGKPSYTEKRMQLFMQSLQYASDEIKALLAKGISVACDRWVWTTLAYHFAFNDSLRSKALLKWRQYIPKNLVRPDFNFLIQVKDKAEWMRRVMARPELTAHDKMVVHDHYRSQMILDLFRLLNPGFISLDNSGALSQSLDLVSAQLN